MQQYIDLLKELIYDGNPKGDRTGHGTLSKFGHQMRFDLQAGFPLVTTRRIHAKSMIHELLWMLSGDTNINYLKDHGVSIWNEWADTESGELGPLYGKQWRNFGGSATRDGVDQITEALRLIKHNPNSRRIVISAWDATELPDESISPQVNVANGKMALAPCHCLVQFYVYNGRLSCQLYQRSADSAVGVPYNISAYALLTHMMAQQAELQPGEFIWTGGDTHLYASHVPGARLQITREPKLLPELVIKRKPESIFDYRFEDFEIIGYEPWPGIKYDIAV